MRCDMSIKTFMTYLFFIFAATQLSGCSSPIEAISKIGKVMWDPSTPVGKEKEQLSIVSLTLLAEPEINPNDQGEATPVQLQIVYMNEESIFASLDQDQIIEEDCDLKTLLKKNYIDHQDYTLLPDQYKPLDPIELDKKNKYIGIIAYYSDVNITQWKKILKINGIGHHYNLLVHIKENEIEFRKEEEQ